MRGLLASYGSKPQQITITLWSLVEPNELAHADYEMRQEIFGDAKLGLLYSGNLGRALVQRVCRFSSCLQNDSVHFCFAGRGPRLAELEQNVGRADTNVACQGLPRKRFWKNFRGVRFSSRFAAT